MSYNGGIRDNALKDIASSLKLIADRFNKSNKQDKLVELLKAHGIEARGNNKELYAVSERNGCTLEVNLTMALPQFKDWLWSLEERQK